MFIHAVSHDPRRDKDSSPMVTIHHIRAFAQLLVNEAREAIAALSESRDVARRTDRRLSDIGLRRSKIPSDIRAKDAALHQLSPPLFLEW